MKFDPVLFAKAISDDTRQKIMECCCCEWCSVNDIVDKVDVSQPTVSHHLAILRDALSLDKLTTAALERSAIARYQGV